MDSRHDTDLGGQPFLGDQPMKRPARRGRWILAAGVAAVGAWLVLSGVTVGAGQAVLVSFFGNPQRVLTRPGFYLSWPAPAGSVVLVDTRLHTTMGTLQDVVMRDGQHLEVQAFAAWRVPAETGAVTDFVRAAGHNSDAAARDIQGLLDTALADAAPGFAAADLFGSDPQKLRLAAFGGGLKDAIAKQAREAFGVVVLHTGIVRLTLPAAALAATEARMRAQRDAEAADRIAQAQVQASEIRADADRDSRIAVAEAQTEAASIEAASAREAADIQAKAYSADPDLYLMLRSLDTLSTMVGPSTRLVLRTDAAPFNLLVQGPPTEVLGK
jgi:membrane protease subunit HflC